VYFSLGDVDYYNILELSRDCSYHEVSKAHNRMSERYNPDNNPGILGGHIFIE
jgi:DnaJ-class molecular chaperone